MLRRSICVHLRSSAVAVGSACTAALLAASGCGFPRADLERGIRPSGAEFAAERPPVEPLASVTAPWRSFGAADPARALPGAGRSSLPGTEARVAFRCVWVPSPAEDTPDIEGGFGEGVSFLYRPESPGSPEGDLYFEWGASRSAHEEDLTGNAAEYWRVTAGFRWVLPWAGAEWGAGGSGRPSGLPEVFLSMGAGFHELSVSGGEETSGPGVYAGGGVEFLFGRSFSGVIDLKVHYFWGDELPEGGTAHGLSVAIAAGIGLRM